MIKNWTVKNFKSIYEKTTLDFAPLTIFTGANSSGKSTLIQSLLLVTQTLQSAVHSRSVVLNGYILRLGSYNDLVSNHHEDDAISIGFQLAPLPVEEINLLKSDYQRYMFLKREALPSLINCNFSFSANGSAEEKEQLQLQPRLESCYIMVETGLEEGRKHKKAINIKRSLLSLEERKQEFLISDKSFKNELTSLEYEVIKTSSEKKIMGNWNTKSSGEPVGAVIEHFLPSMISVVFDAVHEQARHVVDAFMSNRHGHLVYKDKGAEIENSTLANNKDFKRIMIDIVNEVSSDIDHLTPKIRNTLQKLNSEVTPEKIRDLNSMLPKSVQSSLAQQLDEKYNELLYAARATRQSEYRLALAPLSSYYDISPDYIKEFFKKSVKYLGPLRDEPKPIYPLAGATDPKDIGFKGEYTAAVLDLHRNTPIEYIPSSNFALDATIDVSPKNATLLNAVLDWLNYMGVVSDVRTADRGKFGHELKVSTTKEGDLHDLTHVGVGVSQLLPILVLSLLADKGTTLIFEQPELHLHPRVQSRLADFYVSMTMLKKQCIVETHSEYLINRLRFRAAISEGDRISRDINIYFVEKDKGHSCYKLIKINKFGVIEDWPKGFFDENEDNAAAILKAIMSKKKRERAKNND